MKIYIVQLGDTIQSIAKKYNISTERLITDNGLINPYSLVVGQSLVILNPKKIYVVKPGDTLESIAINNSITFMQLIRNNPFLFDRNYINQGDRLVIEFNTVKDIQVNGYTTAFLSADILTRSLPYLTYLSINNYRIADNHCLEIISLGDDSNIIK